MARITKLHWLLWLSLAGCDELIPLCLDDYDGDGYCGAADPCPVDPTNDIDQDGICGQSDVCPNGDDNLDADNDGIPDACDICPDDPGNDDDNDLICAKDDFCPESPRKVCDRPLTLGIATDAWPREIRFDVYTESGLVLYEGSSIAPNTREIIQLTAPSNAGKVCIEIYDNVNFGKADGGLEGWLIDDDMNRVLFQWAPSDYEKNHVLCAKLKAGAPDRKKIDIDVGAWAVARPYCVVDVDVRTENYGREVFWQIDDGEFDDKPKARRDPDSMTNYRNYTFTESLAPGEYTLTLGETFGDGWHGGHLSVLVGETVLVDQATVTDDTETMPLTIACPGN